MKPKSIRVGYGKTVSFVKFEPVRFYVEVECDLEPEDNATEKINHSFDYCREQVKKQIEAESHFIHGG